MEENYIQSIIGDPLFLTVKYLDHNEIESLCSTDKKFRAWCQKNKNNIYYHLLARDFNYDFSRGLPSYPKLKYLSLKNGFSFSGNIIIGRIGSKTFFITSKRFEENPPSGTSKHGVLCEKFTVDSILEILWSIKINLYVKYRKLSDGNIIISDMNNSQYIALNDYDPNAQIVEERVLHYTRIYPEVLDFVFPNEIRNKIDLDVVLEKNFYPRSSDSPFKIIQAKDTYEKFTDLLPAGNPMNNRKILTTRAINQSLTKLSELTDLSEIDKLKTISNSGRTKYSSLIGSRFSDAWTHIGIYYMCDILYLLFYLRGSISKIEMKSRKALFI